ncbi:MAG: hypothetical protein JNL11_15480 [Bdellovibrionaceae bacterium]|nr:hypothetical protein [Pseudobdellovibrionaceae bacterium]
MFQKSFLFSFIFFIAASFSAQAQTGPRLTQNQFQVFVQSPQNFQAIQNYMVWLKKNDYDIAGVRWQEGKIEVITNQSGLDRLNQYRVPYVVVRTHGPRNSGPGIESTDKIDPRYLNPQKVEEKLRKIAAQYPNDTRLEQIGKSHQGRPIFALLLSKNAKRNDMNYLNKPTLVFDGMHHAREIMTSEIVMDVADVVLSMKRTNSQWNQLIESWNIWIVPMLNVDGNNIVWTENNWWRKNARANGANIHGVDLNRNYSYAWNACSGSSGSMSSDTYRGPSAASEPETQALMKLGYMAYPTASLSYHSYSELVLYPYGCQGALTGENNLHQKIATELAKMLPSDSNRGTYTAGTPWKLLYSVDGDSMGFMHSEFGALAFTFEVNQSFQPAYEVREPTLLKHRKAWAYFVQRMSQNMLSLKVVSAARMQPLEATVAISGVIKNKGEKPLRTNAAGNLFKVLDPGVYTLDVRLADGRAKQIQVQMTGAPQAQIVSF